MKIKLCQALVTGVLCTLATLNANGAIATFEDVSTLNEQIYTGLGGGRYWAGLVPPPAPTNGDPNTGIDYSFKSGPATFFNNATDYGFGSPAWSGFGYSNTTDTETEGTANQYSAFSGSGAGGSANYGVAFGAGARIEFENPTRLISAEITNTTFAALVMQNGDAFFGTEPFGGPGGDEPDFFKLVVIGENSNGEATGAISFLLADFTFGDNTLDYIVDEWVTVDLSPLGLVSALSFDFQSSDVSTSQFGTFINTPTYFAIDNLTTVPLPAGIWLLAPALIAISRFRRDFESRC